MAINPIDVLRVFNTRTNLIASGTLRNRMFAFATDAGKQRVIVKDTVGAFWDLPAQGTTSYFKALGFGTITAPLESIHSDGAIVLSDANSPLLNIDGTLEYNTAQGLFRARESGSWRYLVQEWTRDTSTIYPKNTSDDVVIGGTTPNTGSKLTVTGELYPSTIKMGGAIRFGESAFISGQARAYTNATQGLLITSQAGSTTNLEITSPTGGSLFTNPASTEDIILGKSSGNVIVKKQFAVGQGLAGFASWEPNSALNGIKDWSTLSANGANIAMYAIGTSTAVSHSGLILGGGYWDEDSWEKYEVGNNTFLINHPKNASVIQFAEISDFTGSTPIKYWGFQGAGGATAVSTGISTFQDYRINQNIDAYDADLAGRESELSNLLFKRKYSGFYDKLSIKSQQISGNNTWSVEVDKNIRIKAGASGTIEFYVNSVKVATINNLGVKGDAGYRSSDNSEGRTEEYVVQAGDTQSIKDGIITLITPAS